MSKATITDIAARAGLSTATVDRALNGRKGVSAANRHRVLKAAEDLGYLPSDGMMHLPARPVHLSFLIPFGRNAFMRDVANAVMSFASGLPLVASCNIVTMNGLGPEALERGLEAISPQASGLGIVTTDQPASRAAITRLCEGGIRVVTVATDVLATPRSAYVGVDNHAAGRTAGRLMGMLTRGLPGTVALFLGSRAYHGHQERERGFRAFLADELPGLTIGATVETGEDNLRSHAAAADLLRHRDDLRGIYCLGAARTGIVEAMQAFDPERRVPIIVHDLTQNSRDWLDRGLVDAVIDQNARLVGEQAVIRLLGSIAARTPLLAPHPIDPRIILAENLPR